MEIRHALITGASSGIGLALARKLAASGYSISLIARREGLLQQAADEIRTHRLTPAQKVLTYSADVASAPQAEVAVKAAMEVLGPPDLVVTSAGIAIPGLFEQVARDVFERTMATNYFGSLYVVRAALPAMRARRSGHIVFVSSGAGLIGLFGYTPYSPTKFALRGLAEGLRAELKADNVSVSIVYPPDTDTPQLEEENKTKPEETKLMTSIAKTWTADGVAACIMRGIQHKSFAITPGLTITLMNRAPGLLIPLLHWYCDRLAAGVRRKRAKAEFDSRQVHAPNVSS